MPGGGPAPDVGLPSQPTAPSETKSSGHDWLYWWSYSQHQFLDYRQLQKRPRGPASGTKRKHDPDAWRDELRARLLPILRKALRDTDKEVRTAAAVALGKLRATEAKDDLLRMLDGDKLTEGREAAMAGLMYLRDPTLRETFEAMIRDRAVEFRLRGFALFGLGRLGDAAALDFLKSFFTPSSRNAKQALPTSRGERNEFLIACLAALVLSEADGLDDFFADVARDRRYDDDVRAYAITALGKRRAKAQRDFLVDTLANPRMPFQIRRSAAIAVGVIAQPGDKAALVMLSRAAAFGDDVVLRHFAIIAFGRIGGDKAVRWLLNAEKKNQNEDRDFTRLALGLSGDARAARPLAAAMKDAHGRARGAAAIALGLLGDQNQGAVVLRELKDAKDWLTLQSCALSCGMLAQAKATDRLEELFVRKRGPQLKETAALAYAMLAPRQAVPLFLDELRRSDSVVTRAAIVRGMRYLASPEAADALLELYADESVERQIRGFALVTLGTLADREPFPVLMALGFDANYCIRCAPLDEALQIF